MNRPIQVVAGILRDAQGRILITQRLEGTHMAGRWEFPGGKRQAGEPPRAALIRELREELGVAVLDAEPFMQLSHRYPSRVVTLDFWQVHAFEGQPAGLEGQALRWVPPGELADADILEADRPVIEALQNA